MAAPKGTRPPNAGKGRQKGVPNKISVDLKAAIDQAADHVELARNLVRIATESESDQARVAATKELWDRRFGKSTQPLSNADDKPFVVHAIERAIRHAPN